MLDVAADGLTQSLGGSQIGFQNDTQLIGCAIADGCEVVQVKIALSRQLKLDFVQLQLMHQLEHHRRRQGLQVGRRDSDLATDDVLRLPLQDSQCVDGRHVVEAVRIHAIYFVPILFVNQTLLL